MPGDWPPEGYSEPREYEKNERHIFAIAFVLFGVFGVVALLPIMEGAAVYQSVWTDLVEKVGVKNYLTVELSAAVTALIALIVLFRKLVVPAHEALHYGVGLLLDLNPDYGYKEGRFFKNPRVVALKTGIPIWKNLAMLLAPFTIIGVLSWGLIQVSNGFVAGIAAVILWVNSAASAQDLYHYSRLMRMDSDAKFANFEDGDEIRTEYAVPVHSDGTDSVSSI